MKRFYKDVTVIAADGGWQVALDGRPIRTAGGNPQVVPSRALADAMAGEWSGQGEKIDTTGFFLRDLADYAIDRVRTDPKATIHAILPYAETDTLCYRADPEEALFRRQQDVWEPLVKAAEARLDIRMERVSGIVHRPQPAATLERLEAELARLDEFSLAALQTLASLAASLTIGLAALQGGADADALWNAANLEEDWQAGLWGVDSVAAERRARRLDAFRRAIDFAVLARPG